MKQQKYFGVSVLLYTQQNTLELHWNPATQKIQRDYLEK